MSEQASTSQNAPEPTAKPSQQQSNSGGTNIQQSNSAPNSTNIVGNRNRVTVYSSPQKKGGFEESEPDNISVSLGGMTSNYTVKTIKQRPQEPFYFSGFSPVRLHFSNHVLYCDVKLWGGPNNPPTVEIVNNHFKVRPHGWDLNHTDNALEVVNHNGIPIFQIIRDSASHYQINGFFVTPSGVVLAAGSHTVVNPNRGTMGIDGMLTPIFKYPSWKYRGQYIQ